MVTGDHPAVFSVKASDALSRLSFEEKEDAENGTMRAFDEDYQLNKQRRMQDRSTKFVLEARERGALLLAINCDVKVVRPLLLSCSDLVDSWLEGLEDCTDVFVSRLNMASGFFLALCEGLLATDPDRGVLLWTSLKKNMKIRHIGIAGINELMHILFRVPESKPVLDLREEIFSIRYNTIDRDYLLLAMCAMTNGAHGWLKQKIVSDELSGTTWRMKRATMLRGMSEMPEIDDLAWPEGWSCGTLNSTERTAATRKTSYRLSYFWWERYLTSDSVEAAYSAWKLFLACADRRCWIWIPTLVEKYQHSNDPGLWRSKMRHFEFNVGKLDKAVEDRESKGSEAMNRHLWGWDDPSRSLDMARVAEREC